MVVYNTDTGVLPDYVHLRAAGPRDEGVVTYQAEHKVHLLQLLYNTSMASLYLHRHLLHLIMVFN